MKNRILQKEMTTVCCVCGSHISGPWPPTPDLSHGYCPVHYQIARQQIQNYLARSAQQRPALVQAFAA